MALQPLIAILGTTGVGKSNLGVELALRLSRGASSHWKGAKIINADSMQVYTGLDIITNKIPEAEKQGVEHLLMDFKKPGDQYVVGDFVRDALKLIHEIHERHEIPIVVGGTSYWIQHLMFPNRLTGPNAPQSAANSLNSSDCLPEEPPSAKTNPDEAFDLHRLLCLLDPPVGNRWHWRDTRKVLRSLNIILESRRRASDIFFDQSRETGSCKPRFRTLCFWLYAEPSRLRPRLDSRVDEMIRKGLLDEIRSLRTIAEAAISRPTFERAFRCCSGYKEFNAYLTSPTDLLFKEAVDLMKLSTRQYAKKQISWMRNKLHPAVLQANAEELTTPLYLLDATGL
ncbi:uncharacterized protein LACBIDRAFT_232761 [Laccaria bicolor S238N-H82]|uniref:tRNA dimethylallyltransferase n=1 Tax=Laccaria bicolor (strain S238N-H82 / ATCC MYA-4686) TaxID=486041 RepID=B0D221_LACBS|nr:uncharacterized protein LACBIDRAFT_232761 [Laccaria bicolor S238N-H82]EDR11356.1 predicted protein [Laccaria bicolor S238N-H82]|eukprot:XP_001878657.1 predicted protein [Laccaria bicolor S238N-H82]